MSFDVKTWNKHLFNVIFVQFRHWCLKIIERYLWTFSNRTIRFRQVWFDVIYEQVRTRVRIRTRLKSQIKKKNQTFFCFETVETISNRKTIFSTFFFVSKLDLHSQFFEISRSRTRLSFFVVFKKFRNVIESQKTKRKSHRFTKLKSIFSSWKSMTL